MKYEVIAAFIDKRSGQTVEPGSPVPAGLDRQTVERLVRARCLAPIDTGDVGTGNSPGKESSAGAAPSLFPDAASPESSPPNSNGDANADSPELTDGNGDADRGGEQPDAGARRSGKR